MPSLTKCPQCSFILPKAPRKVNRYNEFVRDAMKNPKIRELPSKQRMKAIAVVWRKVLLKDAREQKKKEKAKKTESIAVSEEEVANEEARPAKGKQT